MLTPDRDWARFCLLAICAACFGADEKGADPVIGGVYAARELAEDSWTSRGSAWPLAGLRVDDRRADTLLVQYTVGPEGGADADFQYQTDCDCFRSKEDLSFAILVDPKAREFTFQHEEVLLKFRPGELDLWYFEDGEKRGPYIYRMTYVDTVDLATHRDPYYSHIGFGLFTPVARDEPEYWPRQRSVAGCRRDNVGAESRERVDRTDRRGAEETAIASDGSDFGDMVSFRDCDDCPEMVEIRPGRFWMGCEPGRVFFDDEYPAREVRLESGFALAKRETTFAEWDACLSRGGCNGHRPNDYYGRGLGDRPVIDVSWNDARAYAAWLSLETGRSYRLPSEAEWEYAARAGATTAYSWGNEIGRNRANCDACGTRRDIPWTLPAGSFAPNAWGLHDMHGNVWEWVEDCWNSSYAGAPSDGRPWLEDACEVRVIRGGAWDSSKPFLRAASRVRRSADLRNIDGGFRVALTLPD